jgi:hypothetical protein
MTTATIMDRLGVRPPALLGKNILVLRQLVNVPAEALTSSADTK